MTPPNGSIPGASAALPLADWASLRALGPARAPARAERVLEIGLVNNMPDGALAATDRQFSALLSPRPGGPRVRLHRFHLPQTVRTPEAADWLARRYRDVAEMFDLHLDGLVVTGSEPKAANLRDETFWPALQRVCDWAQRRSRSTIWSCLAAHAAVLHLHGVERRPFPQKLSGVFTRKVLSAGAGRLSLTDGSLTPHSRHNTVLAADLAPRGFEILSEIESGEAGSDVDIFALNEGSLQLFLQGHPEYAPESLGLEFERDFRRYLEGRLPAPPRPPRHYFAPEAEAGLETLLRRAHALSSDEALAACARLARGGPPSVWHEQARGLYGGWLDLLGERSIAWSDADRAEWRAAVA